ncbi:hypothetical protein BD414DRAFT_502956 [Trametes punicea]|nr:hypothetical protein BD414DRAFT_502956 [Trametes punicea]
MLSPKPPTGRFQSTESTERCVSCQALETPRIQLAAVVARAPACHVRPGQMASSPTLPSLPRRKNIPLSVSPTDAHLAFRIISP